MVSWGKEGEMKRIEGLEQLFETKIKNKLISNASSFKNFSQEQPRSEHRCLVLWQTLRGNMIFSLFLFLTEKGSHQ